MSVASIATSSLTRDVAEWSSGLAYDDLPDDVVSATRRHLLDTLGIAIASTSQPFGRRWRHWSSTPIREGATALGLPGTYPAEQAALVNAVLAHGLDFDDTYQPGIVHIGAVVVPAALAVAQQNNRDTDELLTAIAAGYEFESRLGEASAGAFHRKGWHATPICGAFAAALVAARLFGHSVDQTVAALGIVGSFASGIQQFLRDGTDTKRLHPGWAAAAGIQAARFAAIGFEGPAAILEGHYGLYATHVGRDEFTPQAVTAELGHRWNIRKMSIKPYPCCHLMHAHIDAVRELRAQGVEAQQVQSVTARIHESGLHLLGEPIDVKQRPGSTYGAQFSLPFAVAVAFCDDEIDLRSFSQERLEDPEVLGLAARVSCAVDEQSAYPQHFDGAVAVTLADGAVVERRVPVNPGSPDRPLSDDMLESKFVANATLAGIVEAAAVEAERAIRKGHDVISTIVELNRLLAESTGG